MSPSLLLLVQDAVTCFLLACSALLPDVMLLPSMQCAMLLLGPSSAAERLRRKKMAIVHTVYKSKDTAGFVTAVIEYKTFPSKPEFTSP